MGLSASTWIVGLSVVDVLTSGARGQALVFTDRGGENLVYCGQVVGGPLIDHRFSTAAPTHDMVSVTDPGSSTYPPSSAFSQLDATPAQSGLLLEVQGNSMRGPTPGSGANATADGRDAWSFALFSTACFRLSVSLEATSTEATVQLQAYNLLASGGGQIHPDGGQTTTALTHSISAPGSYSVEVTGTLSPGQYSLSLLGRSEGNTYPFSGSFHNTASLYLVSCHCSGDFNNDGDVGTDADIEAFFACLAGNCCATCGRADFNGDGDIGTDADIESFFRVLAGGSC
jgi:hypothetical protein